MRVRSSRPSMRSERPQSVTWRSGSTPGSSSRSVSRVAGTAPLGARIAANARFESSSSSLRLVRRAVAIATSVPRGARGLPGDALGLEHRREPPAQGGPVARADDVLHVAELLVPGVAQRGHADVPVKGLLEVHGGVVDEQLDAELLAARDLVPRAVEVVVRQPDPLEPRGRRLLAALGAVGRDVNEVAEVVPRGDGLDGAGVGLRAEDRLVLVRLLDHAFQLLGTELVDLPDALLLVREVDAEPPPGRLGEGGPVMMQRRVDVEVDPHPSCEDIDHVLLAAERSVWPWWGSRVDRGRLVSTPEVGDRRGAGAERPRPRVGAPDRVGPRARRRLAELARAAPGALARPPLRGDGPARVRRLPDASRR